MQPQHSEGQRILLYLTAANLVDPSSLWVSYKLEAHELSDLMVNSSDVLLGLP